MSIYKSINPATEEVIADYPETTSSELERILEASVNEQQEWKSTSIHQRLELVKKLIIALEKNRAALGQMVSKEMGKRTKDALGEATRLDLYCAHALERFEEIMRHQVIPNPLTSASLRFDPLGVILAVTPWNAPLATPFRIAFPAVLTGNAVLIKPAPNVVGTALLLKELFIEAGFPEKLIQVVLLPNNLAEGLIANSHIRKVAFVGSTQVGRRLASLAGENVKPILLELGGSDPLIVLKDADIEQAALDAAAARCTNAGQVCCASKRMIVEDSVYDKFASLFVSHMRNKVTGDPSDERTSYGPIARKDLLEKLISQVAKAKESGSKVLLEGGHQEGKGYYFSPVVFEESEDIGFSTDEEFFGPVASLFRAKSADHAISIANKSQYGLGAAVYTASKELGAYVASQLENGFVYINRPPGLHPYIPFGGVKQSGFGKDCGDESYFEYVNKKAVVG